MTRIIGFIAIILAAIVGYMYFFGKEDDKVKAHTIVNETKDLGRAVGDFIGRQKDKYDNGDFDALINSIKSHLERLKGHPEKNTDEVQKDLRDLDIKLKQIDTSKLTEEKKEELRKLIQDLDNQIKDIK